MKIGIVIDKLYPGKIGGAEQYIRNTISLIGNKKDVELILFLNEEAMESFVNDESDKVQRVSVPYQLNRVKEYYEYYIAQYGIQVLFCPLFYIPYDSCSIPIVVSILDIQHEYYPEYFTPELLQYRREETRKSIEKSVAIITISEFSKTTLIEKLNVKRNKIFVTHLNSDSSFDKKIDEEHSIEIAKNLPEHYIFYPANGWAHKNHRKLVDAYKILKEKYSTKCRLVLTGNAFNDENGLHSYIQEKGLEEDIITLGYIKQEEMPYVFANAEMLVFPSLFEGFGIPLVEAMRMGTPIACSSCGSIPEIVQDAAIIFDAMNEYDIADKIHCLEYDIELQSKLRVKGYQRAKLFSWERCAEQTLDVLEKCARKKVIKGASAYNPKIILLLPVFEYSEDIWNVIETIENQTHLNRVLIVFSSDILILKKIKERVGQYSVKIKILKQKSILGFVTRKVWRYKDNIVGVLQVGQVFENAQVLEQIVMEFVKNEENVLWFMPKKEGFWGIFLENNIQNKRFRAFIECDKACNSLLFFRARKDFFLDKSLYWFYGHYQGRVWQELYKRNVACRFIPMKCILDQSKMLYVEDSEYRTSLQSLYKDAHYIAPSIIDLDDPNQRILVNRLIEKDNNIDLKNYYEQIEKREIEFDGILSDGWISKKCNLDIDITDKDNELEIIGNNLNIVKDANLTILLDKQIIICKTIDLGEFQIRVELPSGMKCGGYVLQLEMNQTFSYYEQTKCNILAFSIKISKLSINDKIIWEG